MTDGLWLWRQPHWEWRAGVDWEPEVSSFAVESGGETVLLDHWRRPLALVRCGIVSKGASRRPWSS